MADDLFLSVAELRALIDSSDDAIISKTLDGVITFWNRGAERIFGWTAAEAVGRHITLIIPEERHAEAAEVLARIRRGERVDHFETIRVARNGHRLNISLTVSPIKDDAGRIVGASKIARDITPQRQGEITQARLAALVDSSDDAIISKTLDGVITSWNAGAERIFGWTAAEAVGRHITLIIPDDRRAEEDEVLARIRRGERVDHFETIRVSRNGHRLNISLTISPIRDGTGQILGASKIARDVTERRLMEEERERLLAREQQARTQAEALNRTKDEFLATVSHELRTPLNAIFGWARMLQSADLDDETRARAVATIVRSASAQARLIEDLLDLSRIVTGRMRLEFEDLDLKAVIEAALDTVRPAATAKELALVTALDTVAGTHARRRRSAAASGVEPPDERGQVHASRRPGGGLGGKPETATPRSWWRTPAKASARRSCPMCSSASVRKTAPARGRMGDWASGWPSSATSWSFTAAA